MLVLIILNNKKELIILSLKLNLLNVELTE